MGKVLIDNKMLFTLERRMIGVGGLWKCLGHRRLRSMKGTPSPVTPCGHNPLSDFAFVKVTGSAGRLMPTSKRTLGRCGELARRALLAPDCCPEGAFIGER